MNEQNGKKPFVEDSKADELFASVSNTLVAKLTNKCEFSVCEATLQHSLRIALINFAFDGLKNRYPEKKVFRRELETLGRTASAFVSAIENLNDASLEDAQDWLEEPEFLEWMALHPDAENDPVSKVIRFDALKMHILEIGKWSQIELDKINRQPAVKDRSLGSSLNQLLVQLAAIFEQYNSISAKSACYYDAESEGYKGRFYDFALEFLDACSPDSYFSHVALGKRICRILAKDIQVKSLT
ncbi:hypothetical protein KO498_09995 [Lentibacter algarum]|uniref:hypothetical protein n=1 Tax=Lentibacter algarum TaxID=576131 RepID=UPI001C0656C6|nr:hypothetical protein [Lentibacter algarum]MBU2982142.1 hypothetical protein [Lentibacter algarum]